MSGNAAPMLPATPLPPPPKSRPLVPFMALTQRAMYTCPPIPPHAPPGQGPHLIHVSGSLVSPMVATG